MKRERSEKKRERILSAALDLFNSTHNVKKVSIEDIARNARVSPTTIYNQFGSREDLVREVAKILMLKIVQMSAAHIHSDLPFPRKLNEIMTGKIDIASRAHRELLVKLTSQDPAMAPFIEETYRTEIKPLWLDFFEHGKKEGYVDPSLDDEVLLLYLDIWRAGLASMPELTRDWEKNMPIIEKLTHLVFYGFLKKDIDLFKKGKKRP